VSPRHGSQGTARRAHGQVCDQERLSDAHDAGHRVALGLFRGLRGAFPGPVGRLLSPRVAELSRREQRLCLCAKSRRANQRGVQTCPALSGQVNGASGGQGAGGRADLGAYEDDRGDGEQRGLPHAQAR